MGILKRLFVSICAKRDPRKVTYGTLGSVLLLAKNYVTLYYLENFLRASFLRQNPLHCIETLKIGGALFSQDDCWEEVTCAYHFLIGFYAILMWTLWSSSILKKTIKHSNKHPQTPTHPTDRPTNKQTRTPTPQQRIQRSRSPRMYTSHQADQE